VHLAFILRGRLESACPPEDQSGGGVGAASLYRPRAAIPHARRPV